jgi:hypothetical protein
MLEQGIDMMTSITIEVPDKLRKLPDSERDALIRAGLHEAMRARIRQLEEEIAESLAEIARFEKKYGVNFEQFEAETLSTLDTQQAHEDYNDWFYWQSVLAEKQHLLAAIK